MTVIKSLLMTRNNLISEIVNCESLSTVITISSFALRLCVIHNDIVPHSNPTMIYLQSEDTTKKSIIMILLIRKQYIYFLLA